jgi:hypothetical protein
MGKREGQRKVKRCATHIRTKERREQLPHPQPLMSLACKLRDLTIIEGLK